MPWWIHIILMVAMFVPYLNIAVMLFYALYYGTKIIVWDIKLMVNLSILGFLIPPWIFVWVPGVLIHHFILKTGWTVTKKVGYLSFHWAEIIENNIVNTLKAIELKGARAAQFTALWGVIVFSILPIDPSTILGNIRPLFTLVVLTIGPLMIIAWIYSKMNSDKIKRAAEQTQRRAEQAGNQARSETVERQGRRVGQTTKEGAEGVRNEYREINANVGEKAKSLTQKLLPSFMAIPTANIIDATPLINMGAKEAGKAAGKKAAGHSAKFSKATKGARVLAGVSKAKLLLLLPVALALGSVLLLVQLAFLGGLFQAYVNVWMKMFVGPMWNAAGMGWMVAGDYANYADQTVLEGLLPQISFEEEKLLLEEVGARASCLFSVNSVGCMSEWRMNNTVQPGSEEVGQEYDLEVNNFIVEGGRTLDVSGRRADLPLAVRMSLSNPRYGLKGVPARDISYKIGITGADKEGYYCDTGNHSLYDHTDRGRDDDDLAPGDYYQLTSVQRSKDFYHDNINLASCGLLQPGQVPEKRQAELEVNYTYTSQATQRFQAMSEKNRLENNIQPSFKKSKTADTPVKSYISVLSPVTFRDAERGEVYSNILDVEVGFETDDPGIKYQINTEDVRLTPSRLTVPTGADPSPEDITSPTQIDSIDEQCDFELTEESKNSGKYVLKLNENASESIEAEQGRGEWYQARRSPRTFTCSFELIDPDSISATGETLIKDVEGSYNVTTNFVSQNFDAWNTDCQTRKCPMIVPKDQKQQLDDPDISEGLISKCDRTISAEASSGCSVRPVPLDGGELDPRAWRVISQNYASGKSISIGDTIEYETIREGKTAYTYGGLKQDIKEETGSEHKTIEGSSESKTPKDWQAIGIKPEKKEEIESFIADKHGGAALVKAGNRFQLKKINYKKCSSMKSLSFSDEQYLNKIEQKLYGEPVFLTYADKGDCSNEWGDFLTDKFGEGFDVDPKQVHTCTIEAMQEGLHNSVTTMLGATGAVYSLLSGRPLIKKLDCRKDVVQSINKASSSTSDFGSPDSVWMYNIEEQILEPVG